MNNITRSKIYEDVIKMSVSKPDDVADNGHCGNGFVVHHDLLPPTTGRN